MRPTRTTGSGQCAFFHCHGFSLIAERPATDGLNPCALIFVPTLGQLTARLVVSYAPTEAGDGALLMLINQLDVRSDNRLDISPPHAAYIVLACRWLQVAFLLDNNECSCAGRDYCVLRSSDQRWSL